jgi:hypothetical protein
VPVVVMEVDGWTGGLVLICAYAMVSFGKISPRGAPFQCLNLAGSLMLAANSAWHHAWPSASVNLIWIGVGIAGLMRGSRVMRPDR